MITRQGKGETRRRKRFHVKPSRAVREIYRDEPNKRGVAKDPAMANPT
jgi:hypothetical protein